MLLALAPTLPPCVYTGVFCVLSIVGPQAFLSVRAMLSCVPRYFGNLLVELPTMASSALSQITVFSNRGTCRFDGLYCHISHSHSARCASAGVSEPPRRFLFHRAEARVICFVLVFSDPIYGVLRVAFRRT